ncbi:MAG TPA: hypothetical protein VIV60_34000 [Polyangiaceae bacterium]
MKEPWRRNCEPSQHRTTRKHAAWGAIGAVFLSSIQPACNAPTPGNCELTCEPDRADQCRDHLICGPQGYCVDANWHGTCGIGTAGASSRSSTTGGGGAVVTVSGGSGMGTSSRDVYAGSGGGTITGSGGASGASNTSDPDPPVRGGDTNACNDVSCERGGGGSIVIGGYGGHEYGGYGGFSTVAGSTASAGTTADPGKTEGGTAVSSTIRASTTGGASAGVNGGSAGIAGTSAAGGMGGYAGTGATGNCTEPTSQPTLTLRDGCLGEVYSAEVSPIDNSVEWTGTLPTDLGLTLSASGQLSGTLSKRGLYEFDVTARTQAAPCPISKRHVILRVRGEEASSCPTIRVKAQTAEIPPPEACVAWPYSAKFEVTGGTAPYTWQATTLPTGFDFNPLTGELSSPPALVVTNPSVILQVTDHDGRVIHREFSVALRDKCWFGYVSKETGVSRVHLIDPQLGSHVQRPLTNTADITVEDFKWSPDGKFVSYRVKKANGDYALWLWQGPLWDRELELLLDGSVLHYAWSPDAGVLAAVVTGNGQTALDGVIVTGVPRESSPGTIQGVVPMTSTAAAIDSELTWYGDSEDKSVAFHKADTGDYSDCRITGHAHLGTSSFENLAWAAGYDYCPDVFIYPSRQGYFASRIRTLNYQQSDSSVTIDHDNDALAPSGNYTACALKSKLELRRTLVDVLEPPTATAAGCGHLLAWGEALERIACIGSDEASVWINTLNAEATAFATTLVTGSPPALTAGWNGYPRLMSRSANWFALTTADRLYMSSLAGAPQFTWSSALTTDSSATRLAYSPDETLLSVQRGNRLWIYDVPGSADSGIALGTLGLLPDPCSESSLAIPTWCGSSRRESPWKWASDSRAIAWVTSNGDLAINDLRLWRSHQKIFGIGATPNCVDACAALFRFQP